MLTSEMYDLGCKPTAKGGGGRLDTFQRKIESFSFLKSCPVSDYLDHHFILIVRRTGCKFIIML